jgi:competence protein ComEC
MFSRPLVPALCATIVGILIGHTVLVNLNLPTILLPLVVLLCLGVLFFLPSKAGAFWLMAIFLLIGINSQTSEPTFSGWPAIIKGDERVVVEGTLYGPPTVRTNVATLPIHAERFFLAEGVRRVKINLLVKIYGYKAGLQVGERIRFPAKLREFENFHNPGGFDYRFYMKRRGLSFIATVSDGQYVVPMGRGDLGLVTEALEKVRGQLRKFFGERLPYPLGPLYTALILGERQGLTSELREPFDRSGVGHILAVSGLHLGLVAWLFFMSVRWLLSLSYRLTLMTDIRKLAAIITTFPVIGYGVITGLQVSSQRAMVMVLVFLWSFIIGREKDVWSSLSLAALIILSIRGSSLFATSFQLSFVAVAGILWLAPLVYARVPKLRVGDDHLRRTHVLRPVLKYVVGLIAVTTAAAIITIPLIAHHFHRLSVVALPGNLTVVPIIGLWVIPLGLLSCVVLLISATMAGGLLSLGGFGLNLAMSVARSWSDIPWSSIWVIRPNWMEILLLYGLLFLWINFRRSRTYRVLLALFLILLCADIGYWVYQTRLNNNLRVTILDAGRADIALIQFPGSQKMLVAHNAFTHRGFDLGRIVVAPYLWQEKIKRFDYLLLTDPQPPPTDKLRFMTDNFRPREVLPHLSGERVIAGVRIRGESGGGTRVSYRGWSFLFHDQKVLIEKEDVQRGKEGPRYIISTREQKKPSSSFPILSIHESGAIKITIDQEGNIKMESFLKEEFPLLAGGSR